MSALISVSGLPPRPSGAPETARMRPSAASRQRALVGQMPEADEDFGEKPDAGRRRAVMRLARTRAGHVGSVARGEEEPARAVAEEIDGLAREAARGFEVCGLAARLE